MIDRMTAIGEASGLDLRFERVRPGNTFDAHRLSQWAAQQLLQDAVVEALFHAYLQEGRALSDPSVLVSVAAGAGLDPERAAAVVASDDYAEQVRADEAMAARMGISGVPFFVIDGRYGISGAQAPDILLQVLRRAATDARATTDAGDDGGDLACGPDSC
jgi:predicted DsbA family dithiol-disulfide isomerase